MNETSWDTIFRDSTRFWVQHFCVPVVVLVGVLGNSVTIYILTRKQMRVSANVYLTALSVSDMVFLIFSLSLSWKHYDSMKSMQYYWNYIPFGLWITDAASSTSVWLTVSFTVERYLAVCHPMFGKAYFTEKRAAFVSSLVYVLCFLLTSSTPFEWKAVKVTSSDGLDDSNEPMTFVLENTALGKNVWYRLGYHWFTTIFFVLVPLIILAIGNIFLINAVRMSRRVREQLNSCHVYYQRHIQMMRQEDRMTVILIVVIIVFLICQMPTALILIYTSMHTPENGTAEENILLGLGNICNLLVAINAACNFILFTALSDKYRRAFCNVFCCSSLYQRYYGRRNQERLHILPRLLPRPEGLNLRSAQSEDHLVIKQDAQAIEEMIFSSSGVHHLTTHSNNPNTSFLAVKRCHIASDTGRRWNVSQKWGSNVRDFATI